MKTKYNSLKKLIEKYYQFKKTNNIDRMSEEETRVWINDFLNIFGWDVHDLSQVVQEKTVGEEQKNKLEGIESSHSKPDYTLVNGKNIKTYLDAKKSTVDIFKNKESAYQIRSYGWSAGVPCAFLSNFEQLSIFDCRNVPVKGMAADMGVIQIGIEEYLNKFDLLYEHLDRVAVYRGNLDKLYSINKMEGYKLLDEYFNELLSEFRITLANNIYENNKKMSFTDEKINYYVQLIIDRIVFIRVCESKDIEKKGLLSSFIETGFWETFKKCCYTNFYEHYDGAMFSSSSIEFRNLKIDNKIFEEFVKKLYYPYPYRFEVIPVHIIARVYEKFLAYSLTINNGSMKTELKPEYIKSNGVISTSVDIVREICDLTLTLNNITEVEDIFKIRILDPCCGSGIFLVMAFEKISQKLKEFGSKSERYCIDFRSEKYLTLDTKRKIMRECLYGIDIDPTAIEVAKMSLALKMVDDIVPEMYSESGVFGERILKDIHKNIVCGNALVDGDIECSIEEITEIKPLTIKKKFCEVFEIGGFSHIIGNPPYVETKFFKASSLAMHGYLKEKYRSFEGKVDLSVLFLERCLGLLQEKGVLGFIIQRRWFKTKYGINARKMIADSGYLKTLLDIATTKLFPGRTTYVSIMILNKARQDYVNYDYIPGEDRIDVINYLEQKDVKDEGLLGKQIPMKYFQNEIWSPEFYEIEQIKYKYATKIGTLGENKTIHIKNGIQALWKTMYHITRCKKQNGIIYGKNGFNESVCLEEEMVKPVIYNKEFLPLKKLMPDAYCLFPYKGIKNKQKISINEIEKNYPRTYQYLIKNENRIKSNVKYNKGEFWHTFTREHNHEYFLRKKVVVPMTARDTFATFEGCRGFYMDNSNVWFITVDTDDEIELKAIAMIINSTVFSVFAKSGANPQDGNYYKFNKQFLTPVPFPNNQLERDNSKIKQLAKFYDDIATIMEEYGKATDDNKIYYESVLVEKWETLDKVCEEIYGLENTDAQMIRKVGRTVSRINGTER